MKEKYRGYWIVEDWNTKVFHVRKDGNYCFCSESLEIAKNEIDKRTLL